VVPCCHTVSVQRGTALTSYSEWMSTMWRHLWRTSTQRLRSETAWMKFDTVHVEKGRESNVRSDAPRSIYKILCICLHIMTKFCWPELTLVRTVSLTAPTTFSTNTLKGFLTHTRPSPWHQRSPSTKTAALAGRRSTTMLWHLWLREPIHPPVETISNLLSFNKVGNVGSIK
jgi:hypothetical protein